MLVTQGEANARHFYLVYTGGLDVTVTKESGGAPIVVAHLGSSACLGEMALLYNATRTASVQATTDTQVFCLSRAAYQLTLIEEPADSGGKTGRSSRLEELRRAPWIYDALPEQHRAEVRGAAWHPSSSAPSSARPLTAPPAQRRPPERPRGPGRCPRRCRRCACPAAS